MPTMFLLLSNFRFCSALIYDQGNQDDIQHDDLINEIQGGKAECRKDGDGYSPVIGIEKRPGPYDAGCFVN